MKTFEQWLNEQERLAERANPQSISVKRQIIETVTHDLRTLQDRLDPNKCSSQKVKIR